jgi:hypothetical protein
MEAVHKPPTCGPSPGWAIRVISIVEDSTMPISNGLDQGIPFEKLLGSQRKEVQRMITHHVDENEGYYKPGHSDESIAKLAKVSLQQVEEVREGLYGELKQDRDHDEWKQKILALRDELMRARADYDHGIEALDKKNAEFRLFCTELTQKLDWCREQQSLINISREEVARDMKTLHKQRDAVNENCNNAFSAMDEAINKGPPRRKPR